MTAPLIYIIAGEASGDALGGRLIHALKSRSNSPVEFAGIGGETMTAQGFESLFPMEELSVMGLLEVLPRLPNILKRLKQTEDDIRTRQPSVIITIDSPGFTYRLASKLQDVGIPLVHYVAPSVWAWRPKRAEKTAALYDHLLTLFPFEPPYFTEHGMDARFVGHPALENSGPKPDGQGFRVMQGIDPDAPVLCVLPGSRASEVGRLMPLFGQAARRIEAQTPNLRIVVPTLASLAPRMQAAIRSWPGRPIVVSGETHRAEAFAASNVALAASGTVTLELANAQVPMVVGYSVNPLTAAIARRMIKISYVSLINITLNLPAIPEFIQENCRPDTLATAVLTLLTDQKARQTQHDLCQRAIVSLVPRGLKPSQAAADAVLDIMGPPADSDLGSDRPTRKI